MQKIPINGATATTQTLSTDFLGSLSMIGDHDGNETFSLVRPFADDEACSNSRHVE
jgi:hypothetical protein